jgi:murein DD-endopeptidase MepM/ murein hydrolase activator NlpD
MSRYKFNRDQLKFVEEKLGLKGRALFFFRYLLGSVLLALLYYIIFASIFNTREEERLLRENEILNSEYRNALEKTEILDNVISDLKKRDREIYMSIFKSTPPNLLSESNPRLYTQLDTSSDITLVMFTSDRIKFTEYLAREQVKKIEQIYRALDSNGDLLSIPSVLPLKGMSISQTGASIGKKIHPFYKTMNEHTGIDLLSGMGTEIIATAAGVVSNIIRSDRDRGNQITINHNGGYQTHYAHLGDILVRSGQIVNRGTVIARVGNSGLSFAPHLHYEVRFNANIMDPVHFFFADLNPRNYREMMIIAMNSGQSLD